MQIVIVLDETEPPTGRISGEDEPPVAFAGWLPLLQILERLISGESVDQTSN